MAEYKAIEAAGIRGGWLPVKGQDIRGGQIGISQLLDANDQPHHPDVPQFVPGSGQQTGG